MLNYRVSVISRFAALCFKGSAWLGAKRAQMDEATPGPHETSYDRAAHEYARRSFHELKFKPLDCEVLNLFAQRVEGPVCDLGCGPGQVARYLTDRGVQVMGMDISSGMLAQARKLSPDITFQRGDMFALPVMDECWGGIAAFYSVIHSAREQVPALLLEWKRVLRPGGWLVLSFHLGMGVGWAHQYYGMPVQIMTTYFLSIEMKAYLTEAGFLIEGWVERPHYATPFYWESPSFRGYIMARKQPAAA